MLRPRIFIANRKRSTREHTSHYCCTIVWRWVGKIVDVLDFSLAQCSLQNIFPVVIETCHEMWEVKMVWTRILKTKMCIMRKGRKLLWRNFEKSVFPLDIFLFGLSNQQWSKNLIETGYLQRNHMSTFNCRHQTANIYSKYTIWESGWWEYSFALCRL